jgi:hypothetical protein
MSFVGHGTWLTKTDSSGAPFGITSTPALTDPSGTCFEAVSIMTALAHEKRRVRVRCLVFCAAYRNPAALPNAARVEEYGRAGADWIIVALRAPFDWESYELLSDRVGPAFR